MENKLKVNGKYISSTEPECVFPHTTYVPYDPAVCMYDTGAAAFFDNSAIPWEYTGWRDETMAWKETCYIHGFLNPTLTFRIKGPDALKLFSDTCVNSFSNFKVGSGKHAIMCNDEGLVMADGVLIRVGEDDFITYWLAPYINYALMKASTT